MIEVKETPGSGLAVPLPAFKQIIVADKLRDGYWIDAVDVDGDGRVDLVASGLAEGHVVWYKNPGNYERDEWEKHPIRTFSKPVALVHTDLDGDGRPDLIACHNYGACMFACQPEDGAISWLRNPNDYATVEEENWQLRHIADLMATHRLQIGRFTQNQRDELLALPVVGTRGVHEPIPLTLYRIPAPTEILNTPHWEGTVIDRSSFRVIHGVVNGRYRLSGAGSELDTLFLACEEGIICLYYVPEQQQWEKIVIGTGEPPNPEVETEVRRFKGSGNVAVGRIKDDPCAYIATVEPFHGSTVAVYSKIAGEAGISPHCTWKRTILDVFGDQDKQSGEGNGHHVVTADFDGDGNDEFLVALRGPMPWQGVFYYKAIDARNGVFVKTRVSSSSAARIAVADFDGDGRLDFATTGYYTPGYFLADNPQTLVFLNTFAAKKR